MQSALIYAINPVEPIESYLDSVCHEGIFLLTDSNVERELLPIFSSLIAKYDIKVIVVEAGEVNKNLKSLSYVWQQLSDLGAGRLSILLNLGGGVVTDMGGFAAATFKRGIRYINIPTTILGAADAAVGGKTAIDFNGLKNEIGAFYKPEKIVFAQNLFKTLPEKEKLSGFAEIVKMAMISSGDIYRMILKGEFSPFSESLFTPLRFAIEEKMRITEIDPTEKGERKLLNFGHTAGHAFESLMVEKGLPVTHGEAVAHGILVALILSRMVKGFPADDIYIYAQEILKRYYKPLPISCKDCDRLIEFSIHDKKNINRSEINFVLLCGIGEPQRDVAVSPSMVRSALDIYLDILGR